MSFETTVKIGVAMSAVLNELEFTDEERSEFLDKASTGGSEVVGYPEFIYSIGFAFQRMADAKVPEERKQAIRESFKRAFAETPLPADVKEKA